MPGPLWISAATYSCYVVVISRLSGMYDLLSPARPRHILGFTQALPFPEEDNGTYIPLKREISYLYHAKPILAHQIFLAM